MTRGNQRELARQKNQKKQQQIAKQKGSKEKDGNKGASMEARKLRDADIMRAKQEKAAQKKADGDGAEAGTSKGK